MLECIDGRRVVVDSVVADVVVVGFVVFFVIVVVVDVVVFLFALLVLRFAARFRRLLAAVSTSNLLAALDAAAATRRGCFNFSCKEIFLFYFLKKTSIKLIYLYKLIPQCAMKSFNFGVKYLK